MRRMRRLGRDYVAAYGVMYRWWCGLPVIGWVWDVGCGVLVPPLSPRLRRMGAELRAAVIEEAYVGRE